MKACCSQPVLLLNIFQDILYNHIDGQRIGMTYLRSRGFRDDIIKKFQLGYSTDSHDALARTAKQKGYQEEFLVKTGLCYRKDDGSLRDRFWGRVIFPVHTLSGSGSFWRTCIERCHQERTDEVC